MTPYDVTSYTATDTDPVCRVPERVIDELVAEAEETVSDVEGMEEWHDQLRCVELAGRRPPWLVAEPRKRIRPAIKGTAATSGWMSTTIGRKAP